MASSMKRSIHPEKMEQFIAAFAKRCKLDLTTRRGIAKIKAATQYLILVRKLRIEGMPDDEALDSMTSDQIAALTSLSDEEIETVTLTLMDIVGIDLDS